MRTFILLIPLIWALMFLFWYVVMGRTASPPKPKNKEYQREFTVLSLRKRRQEELDD